MSRQRRYPGIKGLRPDRHEAKVKEALTRNAAWSKLSPVAQLAELDRRLGRAQGAAKQRARLAIALNREQAKVSASKKQEPVLVIEKGDKKKLKAKQRRAQGNK